MAKKHHPQIKRGTPLQPAPPFGTPTIVKPPVTPPDQLTELPRTYQELNDYAAAAGNFAPFVLRRETFLRIERLTTRPLICYAAKTQNLAPGIPAQIEDGDLTGFDDLVRTTPGTQVDVCLISNGGSAEATERIVKLLRTHYATIRFLIPANAYSAATLMCLSGDEIVMDDSATLGPIDPQINGIPTRTILRAFEQIKNQLKAEGPAALTAYMPLLSKYDLHMLELCKSAEDLSTELAAKWLSSYMFKCSLEEKRVTDVVKFLADYDLHKRHARGIDRSTARSMGLNVIDTESIGLGDLVKSLRNQYVLWFDQTPSIKTFENARGINWGRNAQQLIMQVPPGFGPGGPFPVPQPAPQPGPAKRTG